MYFSDLGDETPNLSISLLKLQIIVFSRVIIFANETADFQHAMSAFFPFFFGIWLWNSQSINISCRIAKNHSYSTVFANEELISKTQ